MHLKPGLYPIQVDFKQHSGNAYLRFSWSVNGGPAEIVPADALFHDPREAARLGIR